MSIERKQVGPPLSQAVVHGDTVYTASILPSPLPRGKMASPRARKEVARGGRFGLLAFSPESGKKGWGRALFYEPTRNPPRG